MIYLSFQIFDCNTTETDAFCTNEETQLFIKTMAIVGFENANFTFTVKNVISTTCRFSYPPESFSIAMCYCCISTIAFEILSFKSTMK